jgi:hypothetical protein
MYGCFSIVERKYKMSDALPWLTPVFLNQAIFSNVSGWLLTLLCHCLIERAVRFQ